MFTLLSSAISNTMEVLAPTVPADQHFVWHWNQIIHYYDKSNADKTCLSGPIESTNICLHLHKMCRILCEEQTEEESTDSADNGLNKEAIGPSMEYLLQHKMLDTMSVLAQSDAPLGLCQQILIFFTTLLTNSSLELLPHKCVYSSVQKLIIICGKLIAGPYETTEAQFLTCICDRIHRNPDLINCFLSDSFPLINALLALLQSPDQEISTKAGDSLIRLLSAINVSERAQHIIAFETPFCSKIVDQMVTLYHAIPRSLRPEQIESSINMCFRTESPENGQSFESYSPAIRKFLCFLRWFVFFDMIVNHLPTNENVLSKSLLNQLKNDFLESCICPDLLGRGYKDQSDANEHIFLTTVLLSNCLRTIASEQLATTIGEFLLIDTKSDLLIDIQKYSETQNKLKNILLDRCLLIERKSPESGLADSDSSLMTDNKRIQLCMSSMQLFEDILHKPSVSILNELVINYLSDRTYFDESVLISDPNLDFSEFEENSRTHFTPHLSVNSEEGSSPQFNYVTTSHVQRVLQYFTSLVPDELKSCQTTDDLGYETYVREAQKHFEEIAIICNKWKHWSTETFVLEDLQKENTSEDVLINSINAIPVLSHNSKSKVFFEGPFLAMVFDNLEYMVRLPYEVNLQVTSLISKLALIPHKDLNEYLLDPTIPLVKGTRSLFTILHKLVDELQISVQGLVGLRNKLQITRKSLLGETDKTPNELLVPTDEQTNRIIEALIVIEEFCKELAAISFIKYHNTF